MKDGICSQGSRRHSMAWEIEVNMKLHTNVIYRIFMRKPVSNMSLFPCDLSPTIENTKFPSFGSSD